MLLSKNQKLRFAIRSSKPNFVKSQVWVAWINGNDVYLSAKVSSGIMKVSLHASGKCSYALTSEFYSHGPPLRNSTRRIIEWERSPFQGIDHAKCLELYFILIGGGYEIESDTKKLTLLPDAPTGFRTEVSVFYSETNPLLWRSSTWLTSNIIAVWKLASEDYVCIRRRAIELTDVEFQRILTIGNSKDRLYLSNENPRVLSGGLSTLELSESFPQLGRIYILEKVDQGFAMGSRPSWYVFNGNIRKKTQ